jgi:HlyD family secretion protein/macrolide-specific efflux system membrane fusion protein
VSARRTRGRRWLWLVALPLLAGGGLFWARRGGAAPAPIDPALLVTAKRGSLVVDVFETGKVVPRERVELKSKVAGQVTEVLVDEGAHVDKGQLVLVLDPLDAQRDVAHAEADVARARVDVEFAVLMLERKRAGVAASVTTVLDYDTAKNDLRAKEAALKGMQATLAAAQDRYRYTRIYAPMSGIVIQRGVQPGEVVVPGVQATFDGKALLVVADLSTLIVKIDLNQIDVARVRLGQAATVTLDALPGHSYTAKVTKIAPGSVRPPGKDMDVFPVEATLEQADAQIKPGMTADVRIHLEEKPAVISLPVEAVLREGQKTFVTRVGADEKGRPRPEKIEVAVGARNDRAMEIVSGLVEDDRVLLNPASAADNETKM